MNPGTGTSSMGGNHPPEDETVVELHIDEIFALSPKRDGANPIAGYSTG
jgi:hypothetical protein